MKHSHMDARFREKKDDKYLMCNQIEYRRCWSQRVAQMLRKTRWKWREIPLIAHPPSYTRTPSSPARSVSWSCCGRGGGICHRKIREMSTCHFTVRDGQIMGVDLFIILRRGVWSTSGWSHLRGWLLPDENPRAGRERSIPLEYPSECQEPAYSALPCDPPAGLRSKPDFW